NAIVLPDDLMETALETADAIAANAPLAVRATWRGVRELLPPPLREAYRRQEELGPPLRRTEDARGAQRALGEPRGPIRAGRGRPALAVVFDMDGVLLDTERLYTEATQEIVGRFGKRFDWLVKANMIGRPARDSARYLVDTLELPMTADDYLREREVIFHTLMP